VRRLLATGVLIACVAFAGGAAGAARFEGEGLILTADGGFTPYRLPRRAYAPIEFKGWANFKAKDGGVPNALQQVVLGFDRDGRLSTHGLATCDPALLEEAAPEEARARCPRAIVGTGHVEALIAGVGSQPPIHAASLVTLFNGPPEAGHPTAILHARTTEPGVQNFVIAIPIVKRHGRYWATIDVPPIAGGRGALAHIDIDVGRRYRSAGKKRSYLSARCSDGILATSGRFAFAGENGGIAIKGSVERGCGMR